MKNLNIITSFGVGVNTYELNYIISSDSTLEAAQQKAKDLESTVQKKGGVIVQQSSPMANPLSYPIKGFSSGFVVSLVFQSESEAIREIEKDVQKDSQIIRSLMLQKNPTKIKKAPRTKPESIFSFFGKSKKEEAKQEEKTENIKEESVPVNEEKKKEPEEKVELKDIDKELEKILGE